MKFEKALLKEKKRLIQSINEKETFIKKAPQGWLKCYKDHNTTRWYCVHSKVRTYLSKSDEDKAMMLAVKGFYNEELKDERQELRAINMYLNNHSSFERSKRYLARVPEYSRLTGKYFDQQSRQDPDVISKWMQQTTRVSDRYSDDFKVPTKAGFRVRSKSERDIIHLLMKFNVPFKYEETIESDIGTLYPDFTILNVVTGREMIWEHNGMMDDPAYSARTLERIGAYHRLGYRLGKELILTYEENNEGIDEQWVEFIIHHRILCDE